MAPDPAFFLLLAAASEESPPFETPDILIVLFLCFWSLFHATLGLLFLANPLQLRARAEPGSWAGLWQEQAG